MTNKQIFNKYFSKEQIIKNLTSYVLYYQVALGRNVYETIQDQQATATKLKELNLILEPNTIIIKLLEMILLYCNEDNFDTDFDTYLQKVALLHSVEDFIINDAELLNKELYLETKRKKIVEENFFDSGMKMQYLSEYPHMIKHYEKVISKQYIESVQDIILNSITN